jgi:starch synthase
MRIVQTVFGVFHHFDLARELHRRGHLSRIYSTFPWRRLRREGLPHDLVETFPWLHMADLAAARAGSATGLDTGWLSDPVGYLNALAFDRWTDRRLAAMERSGRQVDALIGISGSSLRTGARVQRAGGIFICDRGSTHQRYQERVVAAEYARWGVDRKPSDDRDTVREEAIYAQADAITVPSTVAARSFVEMGIPAGKVHVIPYGVRLEAFRPALTAVESPAPDEFAVLFAGGIGLRKGIPYLLQAFDRLGHPRKRLRLAGAVQDDIRALLPSLPQQQVEFVGPVHRQRLIELMQTSDVLVLPSLEDGFGLVVAEAMACGCPAICSASAGAADLIVDGKNGFVVPSRDPAALAERLQQMADDPEICSSLRKAAVDTVQRLGGWSDYGDRWEALLRQLTALPDYQTFARVTTSP